MDYRGRQRHQSASNVCSEPREPHGLGLGIGEREKQWNHRIPGTSGPLHGPQGIVVTADSLHTQTGHARYLAQRGAHYVFTVKANQPTLLAQLEQNPWEKVPDGDRVRTVANGKVIFRAIKCATRNPWIRFLHAEQAIQIIRKSRKQDLKTWHTETIYAVTSLPTHLASPAQLAALIRGHWSIENSLYWRRDVVWQEDKSQVLTANSPHMMSILRNIAITLLKRAGCKKYRQSYPHATKSSCSSTQDRWLLLELTTLQTPCKGECLRQRWCNLCTGDDLQSVSIVLPFAPGSEGHRRIP
ncbi:hypothetical protein CQ018_17395 [Arthrobacter sp. MYb227]|uniref:ISAs1 family transposase n=1 Tax=Arthrobacter sp. MYb227 TaxID=1848601 RepID=UPI000CFE0259|nr:hypothetical protein CQ018_17395 [Arthrobacter sp. MYb227]